MNFARKHFLLDTNVLIEASKDSRSKRLSPFFEFVQKNDGALYIINASYFELIRGARSPREYTALDAFARQFPILEMREDDVRRAAQLSILCHHKRPGKSKQQISFVDALLGSQLLKFRSEVVLVTADIDDFPDCIFDRVKVEAYDLGERVVTFAFMMYSADKYNQCLVDFSKSKA